MEVIIICEFQYFLKQDVLRIQSGIMSIYRRPSETMPQPQPHPLPVKLYCIDNK